jgi:hypothetical protein
MNAIVAVLGGVRASIFALIAVLLLLACWVQERRLTAAQQTVAELTRDNVLFKDANKTNVETIARLRFANEEWERQAHVRSNTAAASIKRLYIAQEKTQAELAAEKAKRLEVYRENPNADAWGRARLPDRIADSLR